MIQADIAEAYLENGVHEIVAGIEPERHDGKLCFGGIFQFNVESKPFRGVPESLP